MNSPVCYIFGASPEVQVIEVLNIRPGDFVIAADGGFLLTRKLGLQPDLICGDFDSMDAPPANAPNVITLPREKDETDMFHAVQEGYNRGFRSFYIYGGFGGRFDHTLANIQTLLWLSRHEARGFIAANRELITVITNSEINFTAEASGQISVFACFGTASGVDILGGKYELRNATLSDDFPLGVSNEFIGNGIHIKVASGSLIIVFPINTQYK
ncbi:MAG: thiamine diphosphokinase [Oscillospiraceae bacterium]|jgi:thiamine pyrophosphokinase|nr:thiamine diphosphokinase [Oscillospiraceae bacterium]